jgi:integrase
MDYDLMQVNDRLKATDIPVRVVLKGRKLALRATLPNKPEHGVGRKQYDISLKIPRTKTGLKTAENEARQLGKLIAEKKFDWALYLPPPEPEVKTIGQWIEALKPHYFATQKQRRNGRGISEATWETEWRSTFRKLPQSVPLTEGLLLAAVRSTGEGTASREKTCQRLQHLANFAGIQIDLSLYAGGYESAPRDIPEDNLILEWHDLIPNPDWRWVYGMMATFGLRPHECFDCKFLDPLTIQVGTQTKTGGRRSKAIPPEWVDRWKLVEGGPPPGKGRTPKARGASVNKQFRRYDVPMQPYDLRHAFAIRTSVVNGIPHATAAKWMGHSVATHERVYQKWLNDDTNEAIYQAKILGNPKP